MAETSKSFEASMERLETIVRQLEQGNAPLEESLKLFQEGTALVQSCAKLLDSAEQEIVKLTKTACFDRIAECFQMRRAAAIVDIDTVRLVVQILCLQREAAE